jgi:cation transport regulator ChaC
MASHQPGNMNYQHQPCDTYFVESDDGVYASRTDNREFAKIIARQRQELMANELSRQVCDEYLGDIVMHMKRMEVNAL